jgi:hypothetical protein
MMHDDDDVERALGRQRAFVSLGTECTPKTDAD